MINIDNSPVLWLIAALFGACFGSFITLLVHRLPQQEPVVASRSKCPSCHTPLTWRDLFPILSYALSGGRCRHCKAKVSFRYPLIELVTALLFAFLAWRYGAAWEMLLLAGLAVCFVTLIVIDFEHYIIPDELQVAMIFLGVAYVMVTESDWPNHAYGAMVGLGIGLALRYGFLWLRNKDALGMGDVKFLFVVGLWLGTSPLVPFLFLSGVLGIATALLWRALKQGAIFPFGPALAVSMWICLLYPELPAQFWDFPAVIIGVSHGAR